MRAIDSCRGKLTLSPPEWHLRERRFRKRCMEGVGREPVPGPPALWKGGEGPFCTPLETALSSRLAESLKHTEPGPGPHRTRGGLCQREVPAGSVPGRRQALPLGGGVRPLGGKAAAASAAVPREKHVRRFLWGLCPPLPQAEGTQPAQAGQLCRPSSPLTPEAPGTGLALKKKTCTDWKLQRMITRVMGRIYTRDQRSCSSCLPAALEARDRDHLRALCKSTAIQQGFLLAFNLLCFQLPKRHIHTLARTHTPPLSENGTIR